MNTTDIVQVPDPVLRQPCPEVTKFDDELRRLGDRLFDHTVAWGRIGVAAPQIGVSVRAFAIRLGNTLPRIFVNASIVHSSGVVIAREGCLSVAERWFDVSRKASVTVQARDVKGKEFEVGAQGLDARALQHEIDHLNGMLVIDRVREQLPFMIRQRRREMERELAKVPA